MKRTIIPRGERIPVYLSPRQRDLLRDHTFCNPEYVALSVVEKKGVRFGWSLDEIEDIHGHVAAAANHCENRKLQRELDSLFEKLGTYLISCEEES
ncbi:MAG: hypothetical protein M0Q23_08390 [Syntrophales bacterium]|jgi:hypothetical protein|nr:hypothetical protein [Syntrophales bacterium]MCK9528639.1 hypothetical protein [Syntrophales bacterium]MDX9923080.1 hypothetical protein [Syntrophales bacterium]